VCNLCGALPPDSNIRLCRSSHLGASVDNGIFGDTVCRVYQPVFSPQQLYSSTPPCSRRRNDRCVCGDRRDSRLELAVVWTVYTATYGNTCLGFRIFINRPATSAHRQQDANGAAAVAGTTNSDSCRHNASSVRQSGHWFISRDIDASGDEPTQSKRTVVRGYGRDGSGADALGSLSGGGAEPGRPKAGTGTEPPD
jgi:hypothetical protein